MYDIKNIYVKRCMRVKAHRSRANVKRENNSKIFFTNINEMVCMRRNELKITLNIFNSLSDLHI